MTEKWSEAEIAAWVDGELTGEDAERVARLVADDPEAKALADAIAEGNALLRDAFDDAMQEPAPAEMVAAVLGDPGKVSVFPRRAAAAKASARAWAPMALAASLALAVGFGTGGLIFGGAGAPAGFGVGLAGGSLAAALDAAPSGFATAGVRPLLTFRDEAGRPCREFERVDATGAPDALGVACRGAAGWDVLMLAGVADEAVGPDGFAPASGAGVDAVSALLDGLGAGASLSPEEEAALIAGGWR